MSPLHDPTDWPATSAYKWWYHQALEELRKIEEYKDDYYFRHGGKTGNNYEKLLTDVKHTRLKADAQHARDLAAFYADAVQVDLLVTLIAATRSLASRDRAQVPA